ncbi:raffinose/stachyose/melibiose transport system substrate-binding protein [Lipingzhangella halophila]|uniref:Raffinose/stachyose/melibiose transport system substrate-binding protein n=1 Tax=Lipingzhangella halophila TaxID=1783352 RepID=A0A7W7RI40_9ACTN|nr:extracellular solute-binding protein [Lipingzhangella halophila]MBB4932380.1 raffinose/stachyose/melibiose transport system substrate-binding protein [Lipingzhangella halophila]
MSWRITIGRPAAVGVAVCALVGCEALVPGGGGNNGGSGPDPDREVSTELPDEEVTLRLAFTDGPEMVEALADAFEEKHPQVTIEPEHTEFSDYETNLKLMMTSDSPPDIAQYNVQTKDLIGSGHILDLDPYYEAYNWSETFPENTLEPLRLEENGKVHGSGYLYGAPVGMSLSGIFYNKELAEEAGIDAPPGTLEEFERALEQAQDADLNPLHVGALDSGGVHLWTELLNSTMPPEEYQDWVNGVEGGSLTGDQALAATETMVDWAERGYINESASGLGQADSTAEFASGESVFLINGNWAAGQVDSEMGDNAGFFLLPGVEEDKEPVASGLSVSYNISAQTEHPDVAAAFLDFLGSPEAAEISSEGGFEPPNAEIAPEPSGVLSDVHDGYSAIIEEGTLNLYPDYSAPASYNEMVSGVQGLLAGDTEPADYLRNLQQVRDEYQSE